MDETIEIPVDYNDEELLFPAKLIRLGYVYKFQVDINGSTVFFELDDEEKYRAILGPQQGDEGRNVNIELLKAIAHTLDEVLR